MGALCTKPCTLSAYLLIVHVVWDFNTSEPRRCEAVLRKRFKARETLFIARLGESFHPFYLLFVFEAGGAMSTQMIVLVFNFDVVWPNALRSATWNLSNTRTEALMPFGGVHSINSSANQRIEVINLKSNPKSRKTARSQNNSE